MIPILRQFLTEWLAWADAGGPAHPVFRGHLDLYGSLYFWIGGDHPAPPYDPDEIVRAGGLIETRDRRNPVFPFGFKNYERDLLRSSMHKCLLRTEWVRRTLLADKPYRRPYVGEIRAGRYSENTL